MRLHSIRQHSCCHVIAEVAAWRQRLGFAPPVALGCATRDGRDQHTGLRRCFARESAAECAHPVPVPAAVCVHAAAGWNGRRVVDVSLASVGVCGTCRISPRVDRRSSLHALFVLTARHCAARPGCASVRTWRRRPWRASTNLDAVMPALLELRRLVLPVQPHACVCVRLQVCCVCACVIVSW